MALDNISTALLDARDWLIYDQLPAQAAFAEHFAAVQHGSVGEVQLPADFEEASPQQFLEAGLSLGGSTVLPSFDVREDVWNLLGDTDALLGSMAPLPEPHFDLFG